jgi:hypothetical protein
VPDYQQKDFHTVTAYVYGRLDLVDFLVQVLGAKERHRGSNPEMLHGEFTIGDSVIRSALASRFLRSFVLRLSGELDLIRKSRHRVPSMSTSATWKQRTSALCKWV